MVISFTIEYCDIELEHYVQMLVNKLLTMLGILDMITGYYFSNIIDKQTYFTAVSC